MKVVSQLPPAQMPATSELVGAMGWRGDRCSPRVKSMSFREPTVKNSLEKGDERVQKGTSAAKMDQTHSEALSLPDSLMHLGHTFDDTFHFMAQE